MGHLWGGLSATLSLGNMAGADHSNISLALERLVVVLQNLVWLLLFWFQKKPPFHQQGIDFAHSTFFPVSLFMC